MNTGQTHQNIQFSDESLELVKNIIARYPEGKQKSALLPILHLAQAEFDGWLSAPVMDYVASLLNIQPIEVYEVASFYSMYNLQPVGKCLIEVCQTSSCWLLGAEDIVKHIEKKLNIKVGETTKDGMYNLKTVESLGARGTAHTLMCGDQFHENHTIAKVDTLLNDLKTEGKRKTYLDEVKIDKY